jgi:hypothetical protein
MSVEQILLQHFHPSGLHGAHDVRADLMRDLHKHKQFQMILYFALFSAVLVVFGVTVWVTFVWIRNPDDYAVIIGALGVSVAGAFELVRRISREWNHSALLLTLIGHAREEQVQDLVGKLIDGFTSDR